MLLWSVYLVAFIGIGMYTYTESVTRGTFSIVAAQGTLQNFYQTVMYILAGVVVLVAPALAATSIVIERDRQSLDLIFSAPLKPKALLVGKLMSIYRYTWMLLGLSLPVTALCVVLGGQTWGQVLVTYGLLSLHALIYSSMALAISAISRKPVAALIYTYVCAMCYFWITTGISETSGAFSSSLGTSEGPFWRTLSPVDVVQAAATYTSIGGIPVPNWILFVGFAAFVTRFFLLGAASALSPYDSAETKNFRITGLIGAGLIASVLGGAYFTVIPNIADAGAIPNDLVAGSIVAFLPLGLLPLLPFLVCSGTDGERKFWPNGRFSFRESLRGTPAGGLPYIFMLLAAVAVPVGVICLLELGSLPAGIFWSSLVWAFGFWMFAWSLGRWSSATLPSLRSARTLHVALLIAIFGLPFPFYAMFDPQFKSAFIYLYPLFALIPGSDESDSHNVVPRLLTGVALLMIGLTISYFAGRKKAVVAVSDGVPA